MANESIQVAAFRAVEEVLPAITDEDCRVIIQDWDETDPDQLVAMRLATALLSARATIHALRVAGRVPRTRYQAVEDELAQARATLAERDKRAAEVTTALLAAVEKSKSALSSG